MKLASKIIKEIDLFDKAICVKTARKLIEVTINVFNENYHNY